MTAVWTYLGVFWFWLGFVVLGGFVVLVFVFNFLGREGFFCGFFWLGIFFFIFFFKKCLSSFPKLRLFLLYNQD